MGRYLIFSTSTEFVRIPPDTLVYIEADGNYSSLKMADGGVYMLTLQLGQIEKRLAGMSETNDNVFIRIGKSLIVNYRYITFINPSRQRLILSDCQTFRYELSASREALKTLKDFFEKQTSNEKKA